MLKCDVYGRTPVSPKDEDDFVAGMLHADGGGLVISEVCPECHEREQQMAKAVDDSNPRSADA